MSSDLTKKTCSALKIDYNCISDIPDEVTSDESKTETTGCKRWVELLCGIRSINEGKIDVKDQIQDIKSFLKQGKTTATVLNFAAVLLIIIVVFITAFYH